MNDHRRQRMKIFKVICSLWLLYIVVLPNFSIIFRPFAIYITENNPYIFIGRIISFGMIMVAFYFKPKGEAE